MHVMCSDHLGIWVYRKEATYTGYQKAMKGGKEVEELS